MVADGRRSDRWGVDFGGRFIKTAVVVTILDAVLTRCRSSPPNILATLQQVQAAFGYIPLEHVPQIAAHLGVTDADVRGVISFYHDLRTAPPGRHIIRYCLGDSCRAKHTERVLRTLTRRLQCDFGDTTSDNRFTLTKVYCLGHCALSPTMMIGEQTYACLTPRTVLAALENHP